MFNFLKKKAGKSKISTSQFNEEEKIEMLGKVYGEFLKKINDIEIERDKRIAEILKNIDQRKIRDVLRKTAA